MRLFSAALLLAALSLAQTQSQPPFPTPGKESRREQKQAASQDTQLSQHTPQAQPTPLTIKPNTTEIRTDGAEKNNGASLEFINTVSTAFLAVFTLLLAVAMAALCVVAYFQWRTMQGHEKALRGMASHMSDGLAETRKATNTAHETFVNAHRPRLTIRFIAADGIEQVNPISGRFLVFNTGDTKAFLIRCYSEIVIYKDGLPATTPYEGKIGEPFVDIELIPGQSTPVVFPTGGPKAPPEEYRDFDLQRHGYIYLIGWIEYSDEAKRVHKLGFARKYDRQTRRFARESDPDYEYDD
jgi:hypothetical protein